MFDQPCFIVNFGRPAAHLACLARGTGARLAALGLVVLASLVLLAGCTTTRPGMTTKGDKLVQSVNASPSAVAGAATRVFHELGYSIAEHQADGNAARVRAHDRQGNAYILRAEADAQSHTRYTLELKPGFDENALRLLADRINRRLGLSRGGSPAIDAGRRV